MKKANRILTILMFVFLYIPMAVLIVASFNVGKDITEFELIPRSGNHTVSFGTVDDVEEKLDKLI